MIVSKERGSPVKLSPQQLLDCASNDETGNMGCSGGHSVWTYGWLQENKLVRWEDYPYKSRKSWFGRCYDTS